MPSIFIPIIENIMRCIQGGLDSSLPTIRCVHSRLFTLAAISRPAWTSLLHTENDLID